MSSSGAKGLNTCISMYARMKGCYNERGSGTNDVCSSVPHCIFEWFCCLQFAMEPTHPCMSISGAKGLNTYISMYAGMKGCYNGLGSGTNDVCSSIPHCIFEWFCCLQFAVEPTHPCYIYYTSWQWLAGNKMSLPTYNQ